MYSFVNSVTRYLVSESRGLAVGTDVLPPPDASSLLLFLCPVQFERDGVVVGLLVDPVVVTGQQVVDQHRCLKTLEGK